MQIKVPFENGLLPDQYGKYAAGSDVYSGKPVHSFPITIEDAPADTRSYALTFVDFDSTPVAGFVWIHWLAANIDGTMKLIPDDASRQLAGQFTQGHNSNVSRYVGASDPEVISRYVGPQPPDRTHDYTLTVYALDAMLPLDEGFYLNELRHALKGHVLAEAKLEVPSRA
ncbi:MAG: YbhB/YbcL family Raf kinase inhibitor-like protein [Lacticaseibacillus songhuajiangensis]|jgi:Raf kinase inhibitor-like YbhB/YbcL family protein|nr:YbhB/YbcL family Raf kinase inhibitor-like protein [Lacticaseibacillus songhuajiangensis]